MSFFDGEFLKCDILPVSNDPVFNAEVRVSALVCIVERERESDKGSVSEQRHSCGTTDAKSPVSVIHSVYTVL